jgi:serine/threonine-protein phosphatase CPPED1
VHRALPQNEAAKSSSTPFTFVIGADTQLGINSRNKEWQTEIEYSKQAVKHINALKPRPAFVTMCGDLVDMEAEMFIGVGDYKTREQCDKVQEQQWDDYSAVWSKVHADIPVLCLCGNHDVGNRPTPQSIQRFKSKFGDDYFAFWYKGCYFINLNTNIHNDKTFCPELFDEQNDWLEERLVYARKQSSTRRIFLFGHHPWFLFNEHEELADLKGRNYFPSGDGGFIPDAYFSISRPNRQRVMELCKKHRVDACFAGHFHQNWIGETTWGMSMITTGAICNWLLESTAKDMNEPGNATTAGGIRLVTINDSLPKGFSHCYECVVPPPVRKLPVTPPVTTAASAAAQVHTNPGSSTAASPKKSPVKAGKAFPKKAERKAKATVAPARVSARVRDQSK